MDLQNLAYALTQVVHNFGAASVTGGAVFARWPARQTPKTRRILAWLALVGWASQGASGATFGAISYAYYGQFPDISSLAFTALKIKIGCAVLGFFLAASYLRFGRKWPVRRCDQAWNGLIGLGATALTAAAFLRWFS